MSKSHIKKGRVFMTFSLSIGIIVSADGIRRNFFVKPDTTLIIAGNFKDSLNTASTQPGTNISGLGTTQPTQNISYLGYSEFAVPASQLSSGILTVVNDLHPITDVFDASEAMINLSDIKNEFFSIRTEDLVLNEEAARAFNQMMLDYNSSTGLSNIVVYTTTQQYTGSDSLCSRYFPESSGGFTVDLAVQGSYDTIEYDGRDTEAWIIENCANYGFILRYPDGKDAVTGQSKCPWHLRYVGKVHSLIMNANNLSLEEYTEWIKSYTIDTAPYECDVDGMHYVIYYTPFMGDSTILRIPVSGNYTISGNNIDGFIVTAIKNQ